MLAEPATDVTRRWIVTPCMRFALLRMQTTSFNEAHSATASAPQLHAVAAQADALIRRATGKIIQKRGRSKM
jgi:hypothetical protein